MADRRRFRILSLSGGGFLGLYTAKVLEAIEDRVGEPLGRRFDLIAGTSVGGIIALALGFEAPMRDVVSLFVECGPEIFSRRAAETCAAPPTSCRYCRSRRSLVRDVERRADFPHP